MATFTASSASASVGGKIASATYWTNQVKAFIDGFGPKGSYSPTLGGFTLGNGTITGNYMQIQNLVWFEATFTFGSTSAAASAVPTCTLPVTADATAVNSAIIRAQFSDTGTAPYLAAGRLLTTSTAAAYIIGTNGIMNTPSTTSPFTWANTDVIYWAGLYEAA